MNNHVNHLWMQLLPLISRTLIGMIDRYANPIGSYRGLVKFNEICFIMKESTLPHLILPFIGWFIETLHWLVHESSMRRPEDGRKSLKFHIPSEKLERRFSQVAWSPSLWIFWPFSSTLLTGQVVRGVLNTAFGYALLKITKQTR